MDLISVILLFALGIFLVVKGGDVFVDAAVWISKVTGIPTFIIGTTIVSLATTLPELLVSIMAAIKGSTEMAISNGVGSVIANAGLIMSISIIAMPMAVHGRVFWKKGMLMLVATAVLLAFSADGNLNAIESIIMLLILCMFVYININYVKNGAEEIDSKIDEDNFKKRVKSREIILNIAKFILGTAGIIVGARLLVNYGSKLARILGVSESVIAITLVAIGTSLPELITTISAIAKKQSSLSIGNIIGANIIDITLILSSCSLISGGALPVGRQSITLDLPVGLLIMLIGIIPTFFGAKFRRWQGFSMMAGYIGYIGVVIFS